MTIPFSLNVGSALMWLVLMDFGYSNRCTVVYHHCFNLYFTDKYMLWNLFSYVYFLFIYLLW